MSEVIDTIPQSKLRNPVFVSNNTLGRSITASSTAAPEDDGVVINATHATVAIVITIPNDSTVTWNGNATLAAYQGGAAAVSFAAGSGVTLRSPSGIAAATQYGTQAAMRVGANEWTLI